MRKRHKAVVDAYLDKLEKGEVDPKKPATIRAARLAALEESGYGGANLPNDESKRVTLVNRIFRRPETTEYLLEHFGLSVDDPDPLGRIMRRMNEHLMQGEDRRLSFDTGKFLLKTFLPPQIAKSQTQAVVAHVSPPPEYSEEPRMRTRRILPAGQKIAKPAPPVAASEDEDDDGEGSNDDG